MTNRRTFQTRCTVHPPTPEVRSLLHVARACGLKIGHTGKRWTFTVEGEGSGE